MPVFVSIAPPVPGGRRPLRGGALPLRPRDRAAGFTVIEAAIAGTIIMLFLTSLFALNSNMMRLLGCASEAANASDDLQQRVEQVRLANWQQISDPAWVSTNLLGTMTDASVNLSGLKETITVLPYYAPSSLPAAANPGSFTVTRTSTGTVTVSPAGFSSTALLSQEMLQVNLTATWASWNSNRSRALTTLVSQWGISK